MASNSRQRAFVRALALLCATLLPALAHAKTFTQQDQRGVFALQGAAVKTSARISVNANTGRTPANRLTITFYSLHGGEPIAQYDQEHTKLLHLVLVRDDFREYLHLHPVLASTSFRQTVALAQNHRYYAYADASPHGIGQQVFRFTLQGDAPERGLHVLLTASARQTPAGPYTVLLSQTRPPANRPLMLRALILRYGRPAKDVRPYLGAAAHVVIIDTSNLNYLHVHPESAAHGAMNMPGMNMAGMHNDDLPPSRVVAPELTLHVSPLRRKAYKLFFEFRGGATVYTAPFTLIPR